MLSRKRSFVGLPALMLAALALVSTGASATKQFDLEATAQGPVVELSASPRLITLCPGDASADTAKVQLVAATSGVTTSLRYTWSTTGGRLVGDGANQTWDLSGARPGSYTAVVEVNTANTNERDCMAFSSVTVRVKECAPPVASCPNINILCPDNVAANAPITFSASVVGGTMNSAPVYNWSVSAGTITSGQGTPTITVDTTGLGGQAIQATLEMSGYNVSNCTATCTVQVPLIIQPRKFDEYPDIAFDDEKARLDNLAVQLQSEPDARGYIIAYGSRRGRTGEAAARARRAKDYLITMRGIDSGRIVVIDGGLRDQLAVELWLVPSGASPPTPRP